ncbi:hypothetical protein HYC85_028979 [Camellia sinensis]|uniref:Integrase catalytic domain-containing protein n=1 Tax=Camellia sinensis TaxID=4442 RepID=A0A7J7FYZ9_CAMSI|nr:hypothetical protein HYC85_028979 [Camellia sinensis]
MAIEIRSNSAGQIQDAAHRPGIQIEDAMKQGLINHEKEQPKRSFTRSSNAATTGGTSTQPSDMSMVTTTPKTTNLLRQHLQHNFSNLKPSGPRPKGLHPALYAPLEKPNVTINPLLPHNQAPPPWQINRIHTLAVPYGPSIYITPSHLPKLALFIPKCTDLCMMSALSLQPEPVVVTVEDEERSIDNSRWLSDEPNIDEGTEVKLREQKVGTAAMAGTANMKGKLPESTGKEQLAQELGIVSTVHTEQEATLVRHRQEISEGEGLPDNTWYVEEIDHMTRSCNYFKPPHLDQPEASGKDKEREDFTFCGFHEPWFNSEKQRVPGFEIFFNLQLQESDTEEQTEPTAEATKSTESDSNSSELEVGAALACLLSDPQINPESLGDDLTLEEGFLSISSELGSELESDSSESVESESDSGSSESRFGIPGVDNPNVEVVTEEFDKLDFMNENATAEEERFVKPLVDEIIPINVGTEKDPHLVQIGSTLSSEERERLVALLKDFKDIFAWSYEDIPRIDPEIVQHRILLTPRDQNKASPKDTFPLSHINELVDFTTGHALLSFIGWIFQRGIEVDPSKIKVILEMPPPRTENEVQGFLNQAVPTKPTRVVATRAGEAVDFVFISNGHSDVMHLAQESKDRVEKAIYYLSKKMLDYETCYTSLEKACLALVWATKKFRHYLLAHSVILVSRLDPIKYLFEKPTLTGRLARWLLLLSEFDLKCVTRKFVKGRAVAEFLEDYPVEGDEAVDYIFPDESGKLTSLGQVTPKGSNGHEYILVAIDYFTKWVEAQSYAVLKAMHVAKFIRNNIICRYGVPNEIISDNGSHFKKEVDRLVGEIQHGFS